MDLQSQIALTYQYTGADVKEALTIFQRETLFVKRMIYTVILGVVAIINAVSFAQNSSDSLSLFLVIMCLTVIGAVWYFPFMHRNRIVKAVDEMGKNNRYTLSVRSDSIVVGEQLESYHYINDKMRIWETDTLFVIVPGKQKIFVLPKQSVGEKSDEITRLFQYGLGSSYKKIDN